MPIIIIIIIIYDVFAHASFSTYACASVFLPFSMWISLCERAELEDCGCGQRRYNYLL